MKSLKFTEVIIDGFSLERVTIFKVFQSWNSCLYLQLKDLKLYEKRAPPQIYLRGDFFWIFQSRFFLFGLTISVVPDSYFFPSTDATILFSFYLFIYLFIYLIYLFILSRSLHSTPANLTRPNIKVKNMGKIKLYNIIIQTLI